MRLGLAAVMLLALACNDSPGDTSSPSQDPGGRNFVTLTPAQQLQALDSIGLVIRTITLEENDADIVVAPYLRGDSGGFLMSDAKTSQVRLYDSVGRIRRTIGRRGGGPGEFDTPIAAVRLTDGNLVVADLMGRITVFNAANDSVLRAFRAPVGPIYGLVAGADDELLILGRGRSKKSGSLIHRWLPYVDSVSSSFFPTPGAAHVLKAASSYGWLAADRRGDSLVVVFSLLDTAFVLSESGIVVDRIHLPSRVFRPVPAKEPRERTPQARRALSAGMTRLTDVFWMPDRTIFVQIHQRVDGEDRFRLLHMTRGGRAIHELVDSPRLLAAYGDTLVFVDPLAPAPNRLTLLHVRDVVR